MRPRSPHRKRARRGPDGLRLQRSLGGDGPRRPPRHRSRRPWGQRPPEAEPGRVRPEHGHRHGAPLDRGRRAGVPRLGAASVRVAEGPGHRRDVQDVVTRSGLGEALAAVDAPFIDLNAAAISRVTLRSRYTDLHELWLPNPVLDADVVVSMPKMKTHHWAGVTLSLKNLFGPCPVECTGGRRTSSTGQGSNRRSWTSPAPSDRLMRSSTASWGWKATGRSPANRSIPASSSSRTTRSPPIRSAHPHGFRSRTDPVHRGGGSIPRPDRQRSHRAAWGGS